MVVAFKRMSIDACVVVAAVFKKAGEFYRSLRQTSIWNAISSINTVVPGLRVPPTAGNMPERISHHAATSAASVENEQV